MFCLPPLNILPLPGETASSSSGQKAPQGSPPSPSSGQRPLPGKFRETAPRGQKAPDGGQESRVRASELSHRERRQHRDLHSRGPDQAMRMRPEYTHTHTHTHHAPHTCMVVHPTVQYLGVNNIYVLWTGD